MRIILATIAFVMLATPSWGGETDISFFDKINNAVYLTNESYEFKITLDLFAFLLMFVFFGALYVLVFKLLVWIIVKPSDIIDKKFKPKDDSSKIDNFLYIIIRIIFAIFVFSILILYLIYGGYFWIIVFAETYSYTGFEINWAIINWDKFWFLADKLNLN